MAAYSGGPFEHVHNAEEYAPVNPTHYLNTEVFEKVLGKMQVSYTLWMIVSITMIVVGVCTLCFGYGLCPIALGIWNIIQCQREKKNIAYFRQHPEGMVEYFDNQQTSLIIALFLNIFLGAVIGAIGIIYDMITRSYVMEHKHELL